jgi:hypothetical protein
MEQDLTDLRAERLYYRLAPRYTLSLVVESEAYRHSQSSDIGKG